MRRLAFAVPLLFAVALVSCEILSVLLDPDRASEPPDPAIVKYNIEGMVVDATVAWVDAKGVTRQADNVRLPWSVTLLNFTGDFLYLSAQNNTEDPSRIRAEILVDMSTFRSGSCEGPHSSVCIYGPRF